MDNSILNTAKKLITGLPPEDTSFDQDIIIHTNTALNILSQLGAGDPNFQIEGKDETWDDFTDKAYLNLCKSYVALKVKVLFDPPSSGPMVEAVNTQLKELEARINYVVDPPEENVLTEQGR